MIDRLIDISEPERAEYLRGYQRGLRVSVQDVILDERAEEHRTLSTTPVAAAETFTSIRSREDIVTVSRESNRKIIPYLQNLPNYPPSPPSSNRILRTRRGSRFPLQPEDGCIRAIVFPVEKKCLRMGIAERMNG